MIDALLQERRLRGCFFCADAVAPDLFRDKYVANEYFGTGEEIKAYDESRKRIIECLRPKVVIWIQRYDGRKFSEMRSTLEFILSRTTCIFIQQAPVLNIGDRCAADVFGYYRNVQQIALESLRIAENPAIYAKRHEFEEALLKNFGHDSRFEWFETNEDLLSGENRVRWWDGNGKLYYLDDDHLNEYGTELFKSRLAAVLLRVIGKTEEGSASEILK